MYNEQNPCESEDDNSSQRNCQNQYSLPKLSHIKQEYQEFHSRKDSQPMKLEQKDLEFC